MYDLYNYNIFFTTYFNIERTFEIKNIDKTHIYDNIKHMEVINYEKIYIKRYSKY